MNRCQAEGELGVLDCLARASEIVQDAGFERIGRRTTRPGGDAAVVRIPGTTRGLALTTDCNPRFVALDPYVGAQHAVAEAAREGGLKF